MKRLLLVVVSLGLLSGCASIVSGGPEVVTIASNPPEAKMTLCNERTGQCMAVGQTPYTATLDRSQGFFTPARYTIKCEKEGFGTAERNLSAGINGWYAGNIIFGGPIGILIVDPATGAMWDIKEHTVVLNLSPLAMKKEETRVVTAKEEPKVVPVKEKTTVVTVKEEPKVVTEIDKPNVVPEIEKPKEVPYPGEYKAAPKKDVKYDDSEVTSEYSI